MLSCFSNFLSHVSIYLYAQFSKNAKFYSCKTVFCKCVEISYIKYFYKKVYAQGARSCSLVYTFFEKIVTLGSIFTGVYNESLIVNTSHSY